MIIVAEDVRREYGDTVALDGVSLAVDAGEVFALIGPNGAGKTTLVRALTGTTKHDGHVQLFGSDPRDADAQRVGLLPQSFDPPARLTARELVAYYAGLYDDARPVDEVLADVGLDAANADAAETWYENLSGGQQRRTCVAAALVNDPDVLFLDEPTTGIDPAGRRDLWDLLDGLADGGVTIFLTTHSMAEAARLGDRVGLLADGRLVAEGTPDDLVATHGGEPRVEVELAADADRNVAIDAVGEFGRVETTVRELRVNGVEPRGIAAVLDALDDAGVEYVEVAWRQPDLESVYLALTGTGVTETGEAVARERGVGTDRTTPEGERDATHSSGVVPDESTEEARS